MVLGDPITGLSGVLSRGGVPIEHCAFCEAGHLTAPGRHRTYKYGGGQRCDRFVGNGYCGGLLAWVEDYGEPMVAAWMLGGAEAAYEMVRHLWPTGRCELEVR